MIEALEHRCAIALVVLTLGEDFRARDCQSSIFALSRVRTLLPDLRNRALFGTLLVEIAMATSPSNDEAKELALTVGSTAADAVFFAAHLGEELPLTTPLLSTLSSTDEKVDTERRNREREGLIALQERLGHVHPPWTTVLDRKLHWNFIFRPYSFPSPAPPRVVYPSMCIHPPRPFRLSPP